MSKRQVECQPEPLRGAEEAATVTGTHSGIYSSGKQ
jgi:hypothetical protein